MAVLDLMARGQLNLTSLISHRMDFEQAPAAYKTLSVDKSSLGILLIYNHPFESRHVSSIPLNNKQFIHKGKTVLGFLGAGNYASRVLIPAFKTNGAMLHTIVSEGGTNAVLQGRKAGFKYSVGSSEAIMSSDEINIVAITTQHNSHANLAVQALKSGKHVFVLCPHFPFSVPE